MSTSVFAVRAPPVSILTSRAGDKQRLTQISAFRQRSAPSSRHRDGGVDKMRRGRKRLLAR